MIRLQFYLWTIGNFLRFGTGDKTLREWFFCTYATGGLKTGDLFYVIRVLGVTVMFQLLWWTKRDEAEAHPELQPTVPGAQSTGWDAVTEGDKEVVAAWVKMLATKQVALVIYRQIFAESADKSVKITPEYNQFSPSPGDKIAIGNPEQFVVVSVQGSRTHEDGSVTHYYR